MWIDPKKTPPPHSKPGTIADYFLCIPIHTDIPEVLCYFHAEQTFTKGGGDKQYVRWYQVIEPFITYDIEENLRKEIAKLKGWLRYLWDNWELPWQREGMPLNDTETEIESYIKVMDK